MKIHTSRLSTNQLIQLSQQVLNPSDMRHVGALMRAHVSGSTPNWNREELIAFITVRNGGTPPDQILENMASAQLRKEVETKQPVQQDGVVLRVIDLGKQGQPAPQDPRAAMFVNCATCNKQIAVPAAQANQPAFCSQKCFGAAKNQAANDEHAMLVFMQSTPQFYPCEVNFKEIGDQLERWKKTNVTTADIVGAYRNLSQQGKLLKRLTDADIRKLSSEELQAREKIDPQLGGAVLVQEGQQHLKGAFQADTTNATRLRPFAPEGSIGGRSGQGGI